MAHDIELELTYLAGHVPEEIKNATPMAMRDIYVPVSAAHPRLRIRRRGDTYEITKKQPIAAGDASRQLEQTIPLESAEFNALSQAPGRVIEKDRYAVTIEGRQAEVDVFRGALEGLVLIDFEFPSEAAQQAFTPPACCLADVTQESFIAAGLLAGKTYEDIAPKLAAYGYQRLAVFATTR
ncbi:MAG TPA: hypothetical protein VHC98_03575 [Candidatus Saccharimonadales bacterium]|nr:hypothetical protein [Candidatus Saccharimonadales bacterium]